MGKECEIINTIKIRKLQYLGRVMRRQLRLIIQGKIRGGRSIGRRGVSWLKNLRNWFKCSSLGLFRAAVDRIMMYHTLKMFLKNIHKRLYQILDMDIKLTFNVCTSISYRYVRHTLMNYLEERQLFAMNSFFNKKPQRKWTWIIPNGNTKNEIDYILTTEKTIIKDVTVLNRFSTGSDHRLVRAKLRINSQFETKKKIENVSKLDMEKLKQSKDEYKQKIKESIPVTRDLENKNIDEINQLLTDTLAKAGKEVAQTRIKKENYVSQETKNLMSKRKTLLEQDKRNTVDYKEVNKAIRRNIKDYKRRVQEEKIEKAIEQNKNMKCLKPQLGTIQINSIKNKEGTETNNVEEIIQITQEYYKNLYNTKQKPTQEILKQLQIKIKNVNSDLQPEISKNEIRRALKEMKNNKSPGKDGVTVEMLKHGGKTTREVLYILMNKILMTKQIPNSWNEAITLLLFKKGDKKDLKNYRPITLLNVMYKLLTKILTNRLTTKLDGYQAREQAGFRKSFSTSDHLLTMKILIEKTNEYHIPLYMAFIDFEKAFDSVEHWAVQNSLQNSRIDYRYTDLITNIYNKATTTIKLMKQTEPIKINRGVRQGDTISPKLFNQALEDVFKRLHWDDLGININGQNLNHLRYADDIVLITEKSEELQRMMEELDRESTKIGLKMNYSKTKTMTNQPEELIITVAQTKIEQASFGKLSYILKNSKYPQYLKTRVFNQCILPVLTYGSQTWTFTKENMEKIAKTERSMERQMLNIKLSDKKRNEWISNKTKVKDVSTQVAKLKWKFAGHTLRQKDERWTKTIIHWRPWNHKRKRGRPQTMRWSDDLKKHAGSKWMQIAQNREAWKKEEEAYIQGWMLRAAVCLELLLAEVSCNCGRHYQRPKRTENFKTDSDDSTESGEHSKFFKKSSCKRKMSERNIIRLENNVLLQNTDNEYLHHLINTCSNV
ncbi:unnamed protein product [Diabrotica balteata]|uniref:Reverse transcriptase domain-containing protein n=1 Tax=Diabrotica balteata TaxID=107213 RepID=A0A9N9TCJ3_DIABA|nr:unnamed protein product [Diabrotica balteata]